MTDVTEDIRTVIPHPTLIDYEKPSLEEDTLELNLQN